MELLSPTDPSRGATGRDRRPERRGGRGGTGDPARRRLGQRLPERSRIVASALYNAGRAVIEFRTP